MTELARTRGGLDALGLHGAGPLVLVPTMGALHDGHRALLRTARSVAGPGGSVVVSIFVNPLQFGPGEDLDRYPQTLDDDLVMCESEGADAVFAPSAAEMYLRPGSGGYPRPGSGGYPGGKPSVTVDPGPMGAAYEGEFRPGFFGGVLTVVLKLFNLVRPAEAVFGEKDAQQLAMVRRMVTDLDLGVSIVAVPTVRDPDGLAISSRNRYLSAAERQVALTLSQALRAGVKSASAGAGADAVLNAAREVLELQPALRVDYLTLVDPDTFEPAAAGGAAVLAVAARVGATRLIDNMRTGLSGGSSCC